jgi:ubiquinone/menaquinone biosynthesis C-methylase UbiE
MGCGTGILVPILTKHQKKLLVEYDISKKMLLKNKEKWHIHSNTKQLNGKAEKLPLKNECFSTIICFAILPHIADKHAAYQEFYRVLKSCGHLIILHLMGSEKLNKFHKNTGAAVAHDHLRPASSVVNKLKEFGFSKGTYKESDDLYLVVVNK